jgi:hypothetical protein
MDWYLKSSTGALLAEVTSFLPAKMGTKIISPLYEGGIIVQTVGTPADNPTVGLLVESREDLEAVNEAEATGDLVSVTYKGNTYYGYIEKQPKWTPIIDGHVYRTQISLLVVPT